MPALRPGYRRFEFHALKDKIPGSDPAQVPAAATISFYRLGATNRTAATITPSDPDPTIVTVDDPGSIQVGDQLAVGGSNLARFIVNSVLPPTSTDPPRLAISAITSMTLVGGERFIRLASQLTVFKDPYGLLSFGTSVICDAATGRAFAYVAEPRFDYTMSGGGGDPAGIS